MCPLTALLLNIVLDVLASAVGQAKEIKKKNKQALFADDMIVYLENLKESTKKFLEIKSAFSKVVGYKGNI